MNPLHKILPLAFVLLGLFGCSGSSLNLRQVANPLRKPIHEHSYYSGLSNTEPEFVLPTKDGDYLASAQNAIKSLFGSRNISKLGDRPIIYGTTVNLNGYSMTSNFGRLTAECLATAASQRTKNDLIKMTLRQSNVPIRSSQGEFLLSREIGDLARDFNAGAVLLSTYSVTPDTVYVQVQLVNADTHAIVGTTLYELPNGPRTRALLKNQESVATSRYR